MEFSISDIGAMDIGSAVVSFMSSYLSSAVSVAGIVFACLCGAKYKAFKHDKQLKSLFVTGCVSLGSSIALPALSWIAVMVSSLVAISTDFANSSAMPALIGSSLASVIVSVFAWLFKLGGCALLVSLFLKLKPQVIPPSTEQQAQPQEAEYTFAENENSSPFENGETVYTASVQNSNADGAMSVAVLVVLWMFTFGIGYMYWVHQMTKYLNRVPGTKPMNPVGQCLLCGFVPFYAIYWFYIHGQKLEKHLHNCGKNENVATLCLILGICCPLAASIIMQDQCNKLS